MAGSSSQSRSVGQEQEVEAPTAQGAQQDLGSNSERAAAVPPSEPGDEPALTEALAAEIDEVTLAAEGAEQGLSRVLSLLPEGLAATATTAVDTSALVREGILDDEARLADSSVEEGGPLVDQVEQELKELVDHSLWLDSWRFLGESTQRYRLFAVVAEGTLALAVAQGIGPELRDAAAAVDRIADVRQRALNAVRLAAKESADAALSAPLEAISTALEATFAESLVGPLVVGMADAMASWGKDRLLTAAFGEDDPESMAASLVSRADSVVGTTKKAVKMASALSGLEDAITPAVLDPLSGHLDTAASVVNAGEHVVEAVTLTRDYVRSCRELAEARESLDRAKAQLAPLLSLANEAKDRQLADLAADFGAACQLVADTESELGEYLGGGE